MQGASGVVFEVRVDGVFVVGEVAVDRGDLEPGEDGFFGFVVEQVADASFDERVGVVVGRDALVVADGEDDVVRGLTIRVLDVDFELVGVGALGGDRDLGHAVWRGWVGLNVGCGVLLVGRSLGRCVGFASFVGVRAPCGHGGGLERCVGDGSVGGA